MKLVNFSHRLTPDQVSQAEALLGLRFHEIIEVPVQFDTERLFGEQMEHLLQEESLQSISWEDDRLVVNLPASATIASLLMARLHGLSGHFPPILRLTRGSGPGAGFYVQEVFDLQKVRDSARERRIRGRSEGCPGESRSAASQPASVVSEACQ